jgi:hypothetical protein
MADLIAAIRQELSCAEVSDFRFGTASAILERLRELTADAGSERVRAEFM